MQKISHYYLKNLKNFTSQQFLAELKQTGLAENEIITAWNAMLLDLPKERLIL